MRTYREGVICVVTGASGHVGTNLVRRLVEDGADVRAVAVAGARAIDPLVEWVQADVRDAVAMDHVMRGADVVFHLAAVISVAGSKGGLVQSVNVDGVECVARAALRAGVPRFVHCSSVHAFDLMACRGGIVDESAPRATDPILPAYDRSKAAGEQRLREVIAEGLDAVILNPTGIIGPEDDEPSRMGTVLLTAAQGHLPATVQGSFDWVDVRDVVEALMAARLHGGVGENHLVGGCSASIRDLVAAACAYGGRPAPRVDLPSWFAHIFAPVATRVAQFSGSPLLYTDDTMHAVDSRPLVDHRKAAAVLGLHARPIDETVRDLLASFEDRGMLLRSA